MAKKSRIARRYLVWGRVQGVGYRAFVVHTADAAGIKGWARNLDDGRVEVYAIGDSDQLSEFEGRLRQGPRFSDVRGVECADDVVDSSLWDFDIRG
jgi:acylphosphatase